MTALEERAPETGEAGHGTSTDGWHLFGEMPAAPAAETAQAAVPAGMDGHVPEQVPSVPAHDKRVAVK